VSSPSSSSSLGCSSFCHSVVRLFGVIQHVGSFIVQGGVIGWLVVRRLVIHLAIHCVVAMLLMATWHPLSEDGVRRLMLAGQARAGLPVLAQTLDGDDVVHCHRLPLHHSAVHFAGSFVIRCSAVHCPVMGHLVWGPLVVALHRCGGG